MVKADVTRIFGTAAGSVLRSHQVSFRFFGTDICQCNQSNPVRDISQHSVLNSLVTLAMKSCSRPLLPWNPPVALQRQSLEPARLNENRSRQFSASPGL